MNHLNNFLNNWGDDKSLQKLKKSDKSKDVQKVEVENLLKDCSYRFERSPNGNTLKLWASDIIDASYQDWMVKEICQMIPKKFERYPSLNQVFDLLRPYLAQVSVSQDELDRYTDACYPHLRAKFVNIASEEVLATMCASYKKLVADGGYKFTDHWTVTSLEKAVLGDWLRTYFSTQPQKIIDQGKISNEMAESGNRDYFITPLRRYAQENKLGV